MEKIKFGKIVNTHGLKGELKISSNSDFKDERLAKGAKLIINNNEYFVEKWRVHKNHDLVTLTGYNNINDVEFLKGFDVFVEVSEEDNLEYLPNLINLKVIDQDNNEIGVIKSILEYPMYDILEIVGEKRFLIPFIDAFVLEETDEYVKVNVLPGMGE